MGNGSGSGNAEPRPENTRVGGPDDTRTTNQPKDTNTVPENTRAGGPDDTRGTAGSGDASPEERDNIPRGTPMDSRSATRQPQR